MSQNDKVAVWNTAIKKRHKKEGNRIQVGKVRNVTVMHATTDKLYNSKKSILD